MKTSIASADPRERDPRVLLWCVVAAEGAGLLGFDTLPIVLGAVVDRVGLSEGHAGLIASLELAGMAASALLLAPRMGVLPLRALALAGAGLALSAHAASTLASGFAALAAARALAGLAEGALVAAGNALLATSVDPDRLAARMQIVAGLAAACVLSGLPHAVDVAGQRGAFGAMALLVLACVPILALIPPAARVARSRPPTEITAGRASTVLAAAFLLAAGEGALWAFLERMGVRAGLSAASIGFVLGATTLVGLLGAGLAVWQGTRFGRRAPITAGIACQAASCWVVAHATTPGAYLAATLGYGLSFFFVQPYLVGTAAVMDPRGRIVAAYAGAGLVGAAIGPALGGALVQRFSYPALGWQLAVASAAAIALLLPVATQLDRVSDQSRSSSG